MSKLLQDYVRAADEYDKTWQTTDRTLYRLCVEHPRHEDPDAVYAKLWLIGRTYATGIERSIKSEGWQGSSMDQVARLLLGKAHFVDGLVLGLKPTAEPLTPQKLLVIADAHGQLTHLLSQITRKGMSPRSFVSKYLHFHCPSVPLYDTNAVSALTKLVRWTDDLACFARPKTADAEYAWHLMRFMRLYDRLREQVAGDARTRRRFNVKYVDFYLLCRV
jgi:hypothetical protein